MGVRIDLRLLRGSEVRTVRRLLTRLGDELREDGRVELIGLEVEAGQESLPALRLALWRAAREVLGYLESYFGLEAGTLAKLVDAEESVLTHGSSEEVPGAPDRAHLLALSAPSSGLVGPDSGTEGSQGSRPWVLDSGLLLERLTNGVVKAAPVQAESEATEPWFRYLARPGASVEVGVLPAFVWPERPRRYEPVLAGDLRGATR